MKIYKENRKSVQAILDYLDSAGIEIDHIEENPKADKFQIILDDSVTYDDAVLQKSVKKNLLGVDGVESVEINRYTDDIEPYYDITVTLEDE